MNIGYLVTIYPRATHGFIRREIQALERAGHRVHRFAIRSDRAALADAADLAEDDLTEHLLRQGPVRLALSALFWMAGRPRQAWRGLRLAAMCGTQGGRLRHIGYLIQAAHLARRCRDLGITHLHAYFGTASATVAMLAEALGGPRFSFTVHGPDEFDAPVALSLPLKMHRATFTVAVSSYGRSQLYRWAQPQDWRRIHVVHCGIEPELFPTTLPLPPSGPRLVAVGRLSEQKGFVLLVEAIALAAARLPDLHLTLVGDGPLRGRIETLIGARNLASRITLTGWADEARVRRELEAAQALILPSFAEGLPTVVMEAMAAGRPVIGTMVAGVPELVLPGETGHLVPAGDAQALAAAIERLAATPLETLAEMGHAARLRVLERHDINREAARLAQLFAGA
ncbi:glycosyltransferase [Cereibacter sphaeroides]|uniref:glycosyltransferase n=1 Tax=Cereibacter sphaeroides TaxID=1063 RepID=UPI001F1C3F2A|nr:glycosyltransferase [Cereibacter sphaeroides]MCE6958615.1 glycosyltransferase [Cereibacter sphaeroides]MCE6972342.1 glycosyltransferase [Cereibacter sphaeroides]